MKRIGIDARLLNQTGVGRYTWNLLNQLDSIIGTDIEVYVYLLPEDMDLISFKNKNIVKKKANYSWHSFDEQSRFWLRLMTHNLDLMHFTYFSFPIMYRRPFVITIHDIIPLTHATGRASTKNPIIYKVKHGAYQRTLWSGVKNAQTVITPTQTTKDILVQTFGPEYADKIQVTHEGVGSNLLDHKPGKRSPHKKPYFMYVGNFYPHKNVERLVEAFARVKDDIHLILVGPEDYFSHNIRSAIREHGQEDRIIMKHSIPDKDLMNLYTHARALVHPSLAEGFGLQLLEASYFKCPVIASDIPIFHEILGDTYIPFDPHDIYDIASKLTNFLKKPQKKYLTHSQIKKRFSFKDMAEQTYDIYKTVLAR